MVLDFRLCSGTDTHTFIVIEINKSTLPPVKAAGNMAQKAGQRATQQEGIGEQFGPGQRSARCSLKMLRMSGGSIPPCATRVVHSS
jgi:hypothetical protein